MARLRRENFHPWMSQLAEKHGIDVENVITFYNSIGAHNRIFHMNKRERTEAFFDLYFEGVKEGR